MKTGERSGWILGLILIALGGVFLLQNAGLPVLVGNWWALFILIPAIAAFAAAWSLYQQNGHVTPPIIGLITGGLVPLTVALIFLFNIDFGSAWPVLLVVLGAGMLLRGTPESATENADRPANASS
jgi:cell wall-active antibiotic response 4TMS protein YvqF